MTQWTRFVEVGKCAAVVDKFGFAAAFSTIKLAIHGLVLLFGVRLAIARLQVLSAGERNPRKLVLSFVTSV